MANTDKNIVITPNIGSSTNDPTIVFSGADSSTSAQSITATVLPTSGGTLAFTGSSGQLLSLSNTLTDKLFSVADVSGMPCLDVSDTGYVKAINGLQIGKNIYAQGATPLRMKVTHPTSSAGGLWDVGPAYGADQFQIVCSDYELAAGATTSPGLYISRDGNLGINTSTPSAGVEIVTDNLMCAVLRNTVSTSYTSLRLYNNMNSNVRSLEIDYFGSTETDGERGDISTTGAYPLILGTSNTERLRISSTGNVGIGLTTGGVNNTTAKLNLTGMDVSGLFGQTNISGLNGIRLDGNTSSNATTALYGAFGGGGGVSVGFGRGGSYDTYINFCTNISTTTTTGALSERMRVDHNGYLLVGYTTSNGAYKLQVNSQIYAISGTIATSDGRYKENVNPLENALELVCALNPVSFDWKKHSVHNFDRSTTTTGFIAQEVQTALQNTPYVNAIVKTNTCVLEPEEKDADGNVITPAVTEEFLGVAEGNLIPILTKAIQEQRAIIRALTQRIEALEAKA